MVMHQRRFNLPPLDLIQGFEAAARTLSFTKAAEELVPHPVGRQPPDPDAGGAVWGWPCSSAGRAAWL